MYFLTLHLLARNELMYSSMNIICCCCWETDPRMIFCRSFKLSSSCEPNARSKLRFFASKLSFSSNLAKREVTSFDALCKLSLSSFAHPIRRIPECNSLVIVTSFSLSVETAT
nr:hypothetical protein Iba_chr06aCG12880 [Ipomoea batatas]GMD40217.1 hypothetical protein Iba_chr10aCG7250 [Ipomoea batatas]GMD43467.1 hypothetical protein Iba_chr10cCG5600 [Ipomoea batatas]GME01498.1 hypothetical protein Iba_scaffold1677988CG0020 [Ipomoea batatas]